MTRPFLWVGKRLALISLALVGAALALLAYTRVGNADISHGNNLGLYTYRTTDCHEADADAGDPINVVFYNGATQPDLHYYFNLYHGWGDNGGETQYFKTNGVCNRMDAQPSSRQMGLSRYHARYHRGLNSGGGVDIDSTWGDYSVAAAHYEDWIPYVPGGNGCDSGWFPKGDHAVPEGMVPGVTPSGFDLGRDNVVDNWANEPDPSHSFAGLWYWDNRATRHQCDGSEPASDGNVAFIRVATGNVEGMSLNPSSSNLWGCYSGEDFVEGAGVMPTSWHVCDPDAGEGSRTIAQQLRNQSGIGLGEFSFFVWHSSDVDVSAGDGEYGLLASTDRSVTCSEDWDPNYVDYACESSGDEQGPLWDGDIAWLWVYPGWDYVEQHRPNKNNAVLVALDNLNCQARDVDGVPLPGSDGDYTPVCEDASVTVRMLEGDVTSDCQVDPYDADEMLYRFSPRPDAPSYNPWFDLKPDIPDGRIGVRDIQFVFGRMGSTCQAPLPCDQSGLTCPEEIVTRLTVTESDADVRVDPANQNVPLGQQFTVDVRVDGVEDLGAYEFTLEFDSSMLSYVGASDGWFLSSSGREVSCPDPAADAGTVTFGCGTYRFGTAGPSGSGQLAQVTFEAIGEGVSPLDLTMVDPMDPLAEEISASAENGSVFVAGDSDLDGVADDDDNCPLDYNPGQTNTDGRRRPNGGIPNPWASNPNQDIPGDLCDTDDDNDWMLDTGTHPVTGVPGEDVGCGSGPTNPLAADTDGDTVIDGAECALGSDPNDPTSFPAPASPNKDGDGLPAWLDNLLCPSDVDGDGLVGDNDPDCDSPKGVVEFTDGWEFRKYGTNPAVADTDGDSCKDWIEIVDLDGNRKADINDVYIVAARAFPPTADPVEKALCDLDGNGTVNINDVFLATQNSNLVKPHSPCGSEG